MEAAEHSQYGDIKRHMGEHGVGVQAHIQGAFSQS